MKALSRYFVFILLALSLGIIAVDCLAVPAVSAGAAAADDRAAARSGSYREGHRAIDDERWADAVEAFDQVLVADCTDDCDAALYWKAYALHKLGRSRPALEALRRLRGDYPDSRWHDDARALEIEIRPARAEEDDDDDELKLLALNGLMYSDSDRALEMLEKFLAGDRSRKLREHARAAPQRHRASQSHRVR